MPFSPDWVSDGVQYNQHCKRPTAMRASLAAISSAVHQAVMKSCDKAANAFGARFMLMSLAVLRRPMRRHYAFVDDEDSCRMLLTAASRPHGERWVEVREIRLDWIGKPIPSSGVAHTEVQPNT
ncbi:hypothetical protein ACYCFC_01490 [Stutzerimonas sp. NM35]